MFRKKLGIEDMKACFPAIKINNKRAAKLRAWL
jgi:hypothetical protein